MARQNGNGKPRWTIMVYISADATLANFAIQSLKQLQAAAGRNAVVAAQFGTDGQRDIPRLIFDGSAAGTNCLLEESRKDEIARDIDMADPTSLGDFIDWAFEHPQCEESKHWCLILWGHGPELLFEDYVSPSTQASRLSFLSPAGLGQALANTHFIKNYKKVFDIIAIDACNMSILEAALELRPYADFLIASQEEVPDFSFPYRDLLEVFQNEKRPVAELCEDITGIYVGAYREYLLTQQAQMTSISLSCVRLKKLDELTAGVDALAEVLLDAAGDKSKRDAVIQARANSKSFVAGLYVDLFDFCKQLRSQYSMRDLLDEHAAAVSTKVCALLRRRENDGCLVANKAPQDKHCHGLSIYFPYFTDADQQALVSAAPLLKSGAGGLTKGGIDVLTKGGMDILTKGGIDILTKGGIDILTKGGIDILTKVRRQRIQETERYYSSLRLAQKQWGEFIRHGWPRCLAEDVASRIRFLPSQDGSDLLDQRYSAQQCALNLLSLCQEIEKPNKNGGGNRKH